jgi:biotin carboxyl carrier protein
LQFFNVPKLFSGDLMKLVATLFSASLLFASVSHAEEAAAPAPAAAEAPAAAPAAPEAAKPAEDKKAGKPAHAKKKGKHAKGHDVAAPAAGEPAK